MTALRRREAIRVSWAVWVLRLERMSMLMAIWSLAGRWWLWQRNQLGQEFQRQVVDAKKAVVFQQIEGDGFA